MHVTKAMIFEADDPALMQKKKFVIDGYNVTQLETFHVFKSLYRLPFHG